MSLLQPSALCVRSDWSFFNPVQLYVGRGCRAKLLDHLIRREVLIVATQRGQKQLLEDQSMRELLTRNSVTWAGHALENPDLADLQFEIDRLKEKHFDAVIAFGGGSAIDTAKALNVALTKECQHHTLQALLANPSLHATVRPKPLFALPTTSGTGSEATPFATVWDRKIKKKFSLAGNSVWPYAAFVDADLSDNLPLEPTISTGLDTINQAAESLWNKNANPITLNYAIRAMQLGFLALPRLVHSNGSDRTCREQMAEASLLAGLAISHTRTALCHSISYPITAHFGVPHGMACAFTMPAVLRLNLSGEDGRFAQATRALTGTSDLNALMELFDHLHKTMQVSERVKQKVPSLSALLALQGEMITPGRADNNLVSNGCLADILIAAWQQ